MKYISISICLIAVGCATKTTKATQYCDENWKGRWSSWQECYNTKMGEQSAGAAFAKGFSDGYNKSLQNKKSTGCTTTGGNGLYTTNCN